MDLGLKDKVAMVSAASRGLGLAVARILAIEGAKVSIASSNEPAIRAAAEKLSEESRNEVLGFTADIRSAEAIENWREATMKRFGGVDLLFANSGGPPAGAFLALDDAAWQSAFELLALSSVRMARAVIPCLQTRRGGSIVFSTSSSVKEPIPNLTLSNVVRGSVSALTKTLAREFATDHIRVNQAIPGRIHTDRLRQLDSAGAQRAGIELEEYQRQMSAQIPLQRYGHPEEFARAVVFLLSDAASYITGATLQIDGGLIRSVL